MAINDILVRDLSLPSRVSDFRVTAANPLLNQTSILSARNIMNQPGVTNIEGSLIPGDRLIPSYENYEDLIMNPDNMPNRLQNLERFADNRFEDSEEIPGFNFVDAPTSLKSRIQNPEFLNNPRRGIIDNLILSKGNPDASLVNKTKNIGKKGFNIGKQGLLTALGFATGIPLGILGMLPERDYRQNTVDNFYSDPSTRGLMSQIPGMDQYNTVSGGLFGTDTTYGLGGAIDKRIARIQKTLKKKKSKVLQQRIKDLQELKAREAKALADARAKQAESLESQRRGRRPTAPTGGGTRDDQGDRSSGQTGGYSYDSGGRQGFGYGL